MFMEEKDWVVMSMKVRKELADQVKYLAKKTDLTQSRLLANIVETVVPDLLRCDKLGIFQLSFLLSDLKRSMGSWVRCVTEEPESIVDAGKM